MVSITLGRTNMTANPAVACHLSVLLAVLRRVHDGGTHILWHPRYWGAKIAPAN